jgi:hypothetical protein
MAVYGYCRVSTLEQANEGESLETQRRSSCGHPMHLTKLAALFTAANLLSLQARALIFAIQRVVGGSLGLARPGPHFHRPQEAAGGLSAPLMPLPVRRSKRPLAGFLTRVTCSYRPVTAANLAGLSPLEGEK